MLLKQPHMTSFLKFVRKLLRIMKPDMKLPLLLFALIFCTGSVLANSETSNERIKESSAGSYEDKLEKAVELFYQTRWEEAGTLFNELKEQAPKDPRPHFFESMMPFWEYFFIRQESDLADKFLQQSESAVQLSEYQLNQDSGDTTMVFLLSGLHGYRSLVAAAEKNYRVAIRSGITGFSYTRQLLSIDSDRPDAQIGRGMFYYMVGSVPSEVKWLTNIAGIRGDIEMGFRELEKAAKSDNPVRYDAMMMLMYLHEKESNYAEAIVYAEQLARRFPDNVIFLFKCGELHEELNETDKAIDFYKQVVQKNNPNLQQVTEISKNRIDDLFALGFRN